MVEISDLQAGKAGEYLVCADLIIQGHIAFPSEQGLPYDVVAQSPRGLIKIQVKTMRIPTMRGVEPPLYSVSAMQRGKGGRSRYKAEDADIFAFVSLDERSVGYMHASVCKTCMEFRSESHRGRYLSERFNAAVSLAAKFSGEGLGLAEMAVAMGVSKAQAHRYVKAIGTTRVKGKYLSELTFANAMRGFQ